MSNLKIKVKAFCTPPTLNSVVIVSSDTVSFSWNMNGIIYTSGSVLLEMSSNGGTTWTTLASVAYNLSTSNVTSPALSSLSNGQSVRFRVTINGAPCTNMLSNVINQTWIKPATIYVTDKIHSQTDGSATYKLHVEGASFIGYANVVGRKGSRLRTSYVRINGFGQDLTVPNSVPIGQNHFNSTPVTIPVGVYNCGISLQAAAASDTDEVIMDGAISYGLTNDYYDSTVDVSATLYTPPITESIT